MVDFPLTSTDFFTTVSGIVFLTESVILTVAFILCLFFSIFRINYTLRNRAWFFFTASGVVCAEFGTSILFGKFGTGFIMLFLALSYTAVIFAIRTLPDRATEKQKDFVKYLNQSLYRAENVGEEGFERTKNTLANNTREQIQRLQIPKPQSAKLEGQVQPKNYDEDKKARINDVDFEHVKNVLDRLSYYNLTPTDKRQVKELELALIDAQTNGYTSQAKSKINSGLGSLLKIMSKYGV